MRWRMFPPKREQKFGEEMAGRQFSEVLAKMVAKMEDGGEDLKWRELPNSCRCTVRCIHRSPPYTADHGHGHGFGLLDTGW